MMKSGLGFLKLWFINLFCKFSGGMLRILLHKEAQNGWKQAKGAIDGIDVVLLKAKFLKPHASQGWKTMLVSSKKMKWDM